MKTKIITLFLFLAFSLFGQDQPNIIILLVDDAGYADWGYQGSKTVQSPNVDKLVSDGMNFTQGYVTNSVCAPSRAGILTGQYQNRSGFEYNIVKYSPAPSYNQEDVGLEVGIPTIADRLSELGYYTGAFGKWHLGEDVSKYHPKKRGFDYFYGLLGGSRSYNKRETSSDKKLMRNYTYDEPKGDFYLTDLLTDDFLEFTKKSKEKDKPFFAYMAYTAPHGPFEAKEIDKKPFENLGLSTKKLKYHAMIYNFDKNVGRIVDYLKEENMYENTLFVFLSDNGGKTIVSNNGIFRGGKSSQYEGGIRVPFAMTWPAKINANSKYDDQIISLDIAPTLIEAAGGTVQECQELDGVSLLPIAENPNLKAHDELYWRKLDQWEIVSDGTNKIIINNNDWGDSDNDTIMVDLNNNAQEDLEKNIYNENPNIAARLVNLHKSWKEELDLPHWIGDNVLQKICSDASSAKTCYKLKNRYANFTKPVIETPECVDPIIYYVSTSSGNDSNNGTSSDSPWKTLERVNTATLNPGDQILFKSGDTFSGQLNVDHSGTKGKPIKFGKYGTGDKPIIDGANAPGGAYLAAIYVNNHEYIEFDGLHITNDRKISRTGVSNKEGYGILIHNDGDQIMHHFRFNNLHVEGVYPISTAGQEHDDLKSAGIYVKTEANEAGKEKHIKDVIVENSYFTDTQKFGFWSQHKGGSGDEIMVRNMDFVLRNNHFYKTGGSGITPGKTYNVLVEHNIFDYPGSNMDSRMAKRGSGAWFFNCRNVIAQHNISRHARGDGDTYGIHIDMKNKYVIVQYNYSEDSEGGFVEVLGDNEYATYRYNISVNDALRTKKGNTLWVSPYSFSSGNTRSDKVYIYNNSVYLNKNTTGGNMKPGLYFESKNVYVYNNAFFADGNSSMGIKEYVVKTDSGTDVYVDHNLFQGNIKANFISRDKNAVRGNPLYATPGSFEAEGYKLLEGSPALNAGKSFTEPPFPMAGQGIFKDITAKATKDYFGNPVDLTSSTHIGAYNGTPLPNTNPTSNIYEAENATLSGNVNILNCNQASEGKMASGSNNGESNHVNFANVTVNETGKYNLVISYMATSNRNLSYKINNGATQTISVNASGSWCYQGGAPANKTIEINLNTGVNSIKFFNSPIIDKIEIVPAIKTSYEAEEAQLAGTAAIGNCNTSSNNQLVKSILNGSNNSVTFNNVQTTEAGAYTIKVHYFSNNTRTFTIETNGVAVNHSVPRSGNWCYQGGSPSSKTFTINLNKGSNTIKIYNIHSLDRIEINKANSSSRIVDTITPSVKEELTPESKMVIYPNIVNRGEFINLKNVKSSSIVTIYNSSGQLVYKANNQTRNHQKIPTSRLRSGIYFIKIIDGKQTLNSKIIIK